MTKTKICKVCHRNKHKARVPKMWKGVKFATPDSDEGMPTQNERDGQMIDDLHLIREGMVLCYQGAKEIITLIDAMLERIAKGE